MKKKLIIILLIYGVFLAVIRHPNHMPAKLKLVNKLNTTQIENKENKLIAIPGKKFICNENKQPKDTVSDEVDHTINQTNDVESPTSSINFVWNDDRKLIPITEDEHHSKIAQREKIFSPDTVWNGRRFIITTTAKYHSEIAQKKTLSSADHVNEIKENTNESKQQSPSENQHDALIELNKVRTENQSDTAIEPDKVRCPLVENIKKTAQQINDPLLYEGTYRIVSYEPVFQDSNVSWLVGVRGIVAGSSDEAIYRAGIAISETNHYINEYAEMLDGQAFSLSTVFACYYGPGDIIALGIRDKVAVEE